MSTFGIIFGLLLISVIVIRLWGRGNNAKSHAENAVG